MTLPRRTFSSSGRVFEYRHDALSELPREDVVEVLQGIGAGLAVTAFNRPPRRGDVLPRVY